MFKKMVSSPHTHSGKLTARIMLWVIAAMLPALLTQIYYFGMGVLVQSALAISFALLLEFIVTISKNTVIHVVWSLRKELSVPIRSESGMKSVKGATGYMKCARRGQSDTGEKSGI